MHFPVTIRTSYNSVEISVFAIFFAGNYSVTIQDCIIFFFTEATLAFRLLLGDFVYEFLTHTYIIL